MGAVSFVENMDHSALSNISKEDFERSVHFICSIGALTEFHSRNVDIALAAIPPSPAPPPPAAIALPTTAPGTPSRPAPLGLPEGRASPSLSGSHVGEEAAQPLALPAPPPSSLPSAPASAQTLGAALSEDARRLIKQTGDSLSRPISALGRLFSEVLDGPGGSGTQSDYPGADGRHGGQHNGGGMSYLPGPFAPFELGREARQAQAQAQTVTPQHHGQWQQGYTPVYAQQPVTPMGAGPAGMIAPQIVTPYKPRVRRAPSSSPGYGSPGGPGGPATPLRSESPLPGLGPALHASLAPEGGISRTPTPGLDISAMEAEINEAHARAEDASRDTLAQIFPAIDVEVREMVLDANDGDLGRSIEMLLEMSGGGS
jgi:hypothetical protein